MLDRKDVDVPEPRRRGEFAQLGRFAVLSAVGVIVLVVAVLVIVKVATGAGQPKSGKSATAASSVVSRAIADVSMSDFDTAGVGSGTKAPQALSNGTRKTADGKPRVLFIGAEFCPYCAAERWPLAVALSRFGTLHNLGQTTSSANDTIRARPR